MESCRCGAPRPLNDGRRAPFREQLMGSADRAAAARRLHFWMAARRALLAPSARHAHRSETALVGKGSAAKTSSCDQAPQRAPTPSTSTGARRSRPTTTLTRSGRHNAPKPPRRKGRCDCSATSSRDQHAAERRRRIKRAGASSSRKPLFKIRALGGPALRKHLTGAGRAAPKPFRTVEYPKLGSPKGPK